MSSLSNTQYNSRTMNGLVNVNANTGTFTDLEVNNLVINQSGTAPTMPSNDNSTNIATTAFVQAHASGAYVTLGTTQTITGQKTFSNANTYVTGNLVTNSIQADNPANNINIGTQLTTGDINMGTTSSAGQNVALNWGTSSNSGQLTFRGGSFTLSSTGNYTQSSGNTFTTTIDGSKTSGITNICNGSSFSGTLNIAPNGIAGSTINVGGTATNINVNGTTTFNNTNTYFSGHIKSTTVLTNYIDLDDGTVNEFMNIYSKNLNLNTTQSFAVNSGGFTSFLGAGNVYFNNTTGTSKLIQINNTNNTPLEFQTSTGTNTIRSNTNLSLPITGNISINPTNAFAISVGNTSNIDIGVGSSFTGTINIGRVGATTNIPAITGKYIDLFAGQFRMFSGTGGGASIYTYVPPSGRTIVDYSSTNCDMVGQVNLTSNNITCSVAPTTGNEYTNKTYVDSAISGGLTNYVTTNTTQTISGEKTFNDFNINQTAGTNVDMTLNSLSDNFNFNFGTQQTLNMRYINALNRLRISGTSTTKEVSFGANGNDYIIIKPSTLETILNSATTTVGGNLTMFAGANFTFIPVGTINTSVVSTVPTGFLYCNGQAVSRSIYVNLFNAIGTTFGAGDGSTTFNVPNFQGAF
jgi:hypothetical protein